MTLLENHLEQIFLSANAISDLPFPPPKIFTNALLRSHDITTLIRDTEAHERALFSFDPSTSNLKSSQRRATRRGTQFLGERDGESMASKIYSARDPRKKSAVASVLGGHMMEEIEKSSGGSTNHLGAEGAARGEINVEVLLKGAEKLCGVYPIAGAPEKIATLRNRYRQVAESVEHYEGRVAKQSAQLERMNKSQGSVGVDFDHDDDGAIATSKPEEVKITEEDLNREQEEIRELEQKKRTLEDRVSGMERDLGGLLR